MKLITIAIYTPSFYAEYSQLLKAKGENYPQINEVKELVNRWGHIDDEEVPTWVRTNLSNRYAIHIGVAFK